MGNTSYFHKKVKVSYPFSDSVLEIHYSTDCMKHFRCGLLRYSLKILSNQKWGFNVSTVISDENI